MKRINRIVPLVFAAMILAGCGSSSSASYALAESDGIAAGDSYAVSGSVNEANSASSSSGTSTEITGDKLVYTGSMTIETLNYEDTVTAVNDHIKACSGILEHQESYDSDTGWYENNGVRTGMRSMSLTVRIPTGSFDAFLNDLEGDGRVTCRSSDVENITKQYNDNSAEIEALEKQQSRLLEMMDQAETIEDMVAIEQRLSEVETELNQKKSEQSSMDTDIEYSTVYVTIQEVTRYRSGTGKDISDFAARLKEAFSSVGVTFVWLLQEAVLLLVNLIPYAAVIALIVLVIRLIEKLSGKKIRFFHRKSQPKNPSDQK